MGVRDSWNELGTGGKVLVGLLVGGGVLVVGLVLLVILAAVVGSFVLGMGESTSRNGDAAGLVHSRLRHGGRDGGDTPRWR